VDLGEDEKKKAKTIQSMVPPPSLLAASLLGSIHSRPTEQDCVWEGNETDDGDATHSS